MGRCCSCRRALVFTVNATDVVLPTVSSVAICIQHVHMDPELHKFIPEQFLPDNKRHPFIYVPLVPATGTASVRFSAFLVTFCDFVQDLKICHDIPIASTCYHGDYCVLVLWCDSCNLVLFYRRFGLCPDPILRAANTAALHIKYILKKQITRVWNGFVWLGIRTSSGL